MKQILLIIALLQFVFVSGHNDKEKLSKCKIIPFTEDTTSLIRNPMMGWTLYDDANTEVQNAREYWTALDTIANKYASIFYWRSRWSELEPEEGKYAWECNENFKAIIKGATDRGLKLAFRFYIDGQDNIVNSTPGFVKKAGARGYYGEGSSKERWSPYPDDPIFQEKYTNFVKAFAKRFDNPDEVDFVDAFGFGWWGENHHLKFVDPTKQTSVYQWNADLFANAFHRILLVASLNSNFGWNVERKYAIRQNDFIVRRDGLGSEWVSDKEEFAMLDSIFPQTAFIGESCYWCGSSENCKPWKNDDFDFWKSDRKYKDSFKTWVDVFQKAYDDAIKGRSNTLDLREVPEARAWVERANWLVEDFKIKGGYRIYPTEIKVPSSLPRGEKIEIEHSWRNTGVGICPNNNKRWSFKYKVAFAIIDSKSNKIKQIIVDDKAEPSQWIKVSDKKYKLETTLNVPEGKYTLAVAVVDVTKQNTPGINLAVTIKPLSNGWIPISTIKIKQ